MTGVQTCALPICIGDPGFSDTYHTLVQLGDAIESQPDVIYGGTPGYDGSHDLGQVYVVTRVEHQNHPHYAGYLIGCPACEAKCWCEPGNAECVYGGEHD